MSKSKNSVSVFKALKELVSGKVWEPVDENAVYRFESCVEAVQLAEGEKCKANRHASSSRQIRGSRNSEQTQFKNKNIEKTNNYGRESR